MALVYTDLSGFATNPTFVSRVTVAMITFARFILGEDKNVANHTVRSGWAHGAVNNPVTIAQQVAWLTVTDPNVEGLATADQSLLTDAQLQAAVESSISATLLAS